MIPKKIEHCPLLLRWRSMMLVGMQPPAQLILGCVRFGSRVVPFAPFVPCVPFVSRFVPFVPLIPAQKMRWRSISTFNPSCCPLLVPFRVSFPGNMPNFIFLEHLSTHPVLNCEISIAKRFTILYRGWITSLKRLTTRHYYQRSSSSTWRVGVGTRQRY